MSRPGNDDFSDICQLPLGSEVRLNFQWQGVVPALRAARRWASVSRAAVGRVYSQEPSHGATVHALSRLVRILFTTTYLFIYV